MQNFYARSVLFVQDTPRAMEYYTDTLGFKVDWIHEDNGRPYVVQVSLLGLEIILNQKETPADDRVGHGRIFIGLDDAQTAALFQHIQDKKVHTSVTQWGAPTLVIHDLDRNELYFWLSDTERAKLLVAQAGIAQHSDR
jgi:uncharacterized glyoxalase superfamily protein PhnB